MRAPVQYSEAAGKIFDLEFASLLRPAPHALCQALYRILTIATRMRFPRSERRHRADTGRPARQKRASAVRLRLPPARRATTVAICAITGVPVPADSAGPRRRQWKYFGRWLGIGRRAKGIVKFLLGFGQNYRLLTMGNLSQLT